MHIDDNFSVFFLPITLIIKAVKKSNKNSYKRLKLWRYVEFQLARENVIYNEVSKQKSLSIN